MLNDLITTNRIATSITRFNSNRDQAALGGFDAEAGMKLAQWNGDGDLRSYLGLYYYSGSNVGGFVGVRGRLAANITKNFSAGLSVQGDPEFGTTAAVTVGFRFPGVGSRSNETKDEKNESRSNWARMGDSPSRSNTVAVTERTDTQINTVVQNSTTSTNTTVVAINPATNQPYVFQHAVLGNAGGSGTFESPFGTVAAAVTAAPGDGNGIVYVQSGTNPGIPAFTIKDGVQVLSTGPVQTLATVQQGNVRLPLSGSGTLPTVTGTVTLGNDTTLGGFNITGFTGNGVIGNNLRNVVIRDNAIGTIVGDGINLTGNLSGNVLIQGNAVSNLTGSGQGIFVNPTQAVGQPLQVTITGNRITNTTAQGVQITTANNSTVSLVISNNVLLSTTGAGIRLFTFNNSQLRAILDSNQIRQTQLQFGVDQQGINVEAAGGLTSNLFALITNNQVNNPNFFAFPNRIEIRGQRFSATNLCIRAVNNQTALSGFLWNNFNAGPGLFQLEPRVGNVGTENTNGVITPVAAGTCGFP